MSLKRRNFIALILILFASVCWTFGQQILDSYSNNQANGNTAVTTPAKYAAGEYVANTDDGNAFSITWSWPFETGADASAKAANNVKDTALGDAAAAEVTITVTQTAQQLDTYTP